MREINYLSMFGRLSRNIKRESMGFHQVSISQVIRVAETYLEQQINGRLLTAYPTCWGRNDVSVSVSVASALVRNIGIGRNTGIGTSPEYV